LLNLTDGFLADFLELNIICTFDTDIDNIDPALIRKGRLKGMMEFKKLSAESARKMAVEFDLTTMITGPMTVAEVWNGGNETVSLSQNGIGF